jgi:hypothetical protein
MSPEIENALDRLTAAILPPGQSTVTERSALRTELERLVALIEIQTELRAQELIRMRRFYR